ncbi:MAG: serine/threonine protein kinase, partial [Candidatus Eremiobacteraeota bacterium]|nr:serine/threonine protein kinase [Candidatus Eremiobacteraeota bacterium]
MASFGRIFLVLVCLWSLAWAKDTEDPVITISTSPSCQVYDGRNNYLGESGQPIVLPFSQYGGNLELQLQREGFYTETISLATMQVKNDNRWPRAGPPIRLQPKTWVVAFKYWLDTHRGLTLVGSIAATTLLLWGLSYRASLRRRVKRLQTMERYAEGDVSGSLVTHLVGDYRLVNVLGRGGMATVYQGLREPDLDPSSAVAIKVLKPQFTDTEEFLKRFAREVQVYRELSHPGILALYDWGSYHDYTYLVLELLDGKTLADEAGRARVSPEQCLAWLSPVMEAVSYAHTCGIVHRDLKPENIMVRANGRLVVMDFGLARAEDGERVTQTGAALGTPAYMAPEQIQGQVDPRSDQYAIGVMAYEMLTGRLPFTDSDPVQLIFAHISQPPPPLEG